MNEHTDHEEREPAVPGREIPETEVPVKDVPTDVAEKPGTKMVSHDHADELADEWGEESFPGSDPPAHY